MRRPSLANCPQCREVLEPDASFCVACGAAAASPNDAALPRCPVCEAVFEADESYCGFDGAALIGATPAISARPAAVDWSRSFDGAWGAIRRFAILHTILLSFTALALAGLLFQGWLAESVGVGAVFAAIGLAIAALASWPVALARSEAVLRGVGRLDGWFQRSSDYLRHADGKFRRWILFPVLWLAGKVMLLSRRTPDPFAAASVRVFCYVATVLLVATIVFFAIALFIALVMLAIVLVVLSAFLGGATPGGGTVVKTVARRAAGDQILHRGTNWLNERREGRIDDQGNIHAGTNWLNESKVGRVGDDGTVYEGTNWLNERKTGRVDEDGTVYEGTNWLNERKTGRVDEDGTVYEGTNWLNERKVGRVEKDKK